MNVVIIWNNVVFLKARDGWKRGEVDRVEDAADMLEKHLPKRAHIRLVYDPEILTTELENLPRGGRGIIARVLNERQQEKHDRQAAVVSETLSWGFQPQWAGGENGYETYLHSESMPGLLVMRERLEADSKIKIEGAWPLLTPALTLKPERARAVVTVVHDGVNAFVGGYAANGAHPFTKLHGNDLGEMWTHLAETLRQAGVSIGTERGLPGRVRIFTTATEKQFEETCPFLVEMRRRNTVELATFDGLAAIVKRLPTNHPSNLIKSLTTDLSLNPLFKTLIALSVAAGIAVGGILVRDIDFSNNQRKALLAQQRVLRGENERLQSNQHEITNLKLLYGSDVGWTTPGREEFLRALAAAVPSTASVTELNINDKGEFNLNGVFWEPSEKVTKDTSVSPVAQALVRSQPTVVLKQDKIAYDQKSGRFTIAGVINKD